MPELKTFSTLTPWHILSYGTLLGSTIFQSFIGGVIAFKVLPRPQFATLQSATFPIFFPLQTALSAIIALTYPGMKTAIGTRDAAGWSGVFHETNRWGVLVPVATMFFSGLVNWVWLGPETYRVMKMRKHQETRDGKKSYDAAPHSAEMQKLNRQFGMLHGFSSLANVVGLGAMIVYAGTLAEIL